MSAGAYLQTRSVALQQALFATADCGKCRSSNKISMAQPATKKRESRLRLKMQLGSTTPPRTQHKLREGCNAGLKPHWPQVFMALATENGIPTRTRGQGRAKRKTGHSHASDFGSAPHKFLLDPGSTYAVVLRFPFWDTRCSECVSSF